MKHRLVVVIVLLISLVGCTAPTTDPTANLVPSGTEVPAATEAPAAANETAAPQEPVITNTGESVDMTALQPTLIDDTNGYFRLQTLFQQGANKCLEGNRIEQESLSTDAALLNDCQDVTGQLWKLVPTQQAGYYRLQTQFLEAENKCLEGNRLDPQAVLGGASFLDDCQDVTGQLWRFVDASNGYYRLQTQFLEAENKCFEGNSQAPEAVIAGAAFMDDCQDVTGQLWQLIPVADIGFFSGTPPTESEQPTVPPEPLAVEIAGNVLSVVDPSTSLNGMTITVLNESEALSQLNLGKVAIEDVPAIPQRVTPLSDVFVVPNAVEQTFELRFPLTLPEGVSLDDVNLYAYTEISDAEARMWSPSWVGFGFEGTAEQPIVVVQVAGLDGLAFWGYSQPANDATTQSQNEHSGLALQFASFSPQAQTSVTCVDQRADAFNVLKVCTPTRDPAVKITIRGFGTQEIRWGGVTIAQIVEHLLDAQVWFTQNKLGYDKQFNVYIHQLDPGIAGYVSHGFPEEGKTLHLSSDNTIPAIAMQGTIVHEYFHHAQGHPDTEQGKTPLFETWLREGTARWFEDELYDDKNTYLLKESSGQRIAEAGINGGGRPYNRFSFFKALTRSCPQFVPDLAKIFTAENATTTGIANLTSLFGPMGCNFGNHLGSDKASSLEALLDYYNYATQFKNKLSLLDSNEADKAFFEKPPYTFQNWRGAKIEQWLTGARNVPTLSGVSSIPPVGAYSFIIPAISGDLPPGKVAELVVVANQPITISLTSNNRQFNGMNTIGPDNDPHAWFLAASGKPGSYRYSANCTVPELFATLINPNLKDAATGVKVTLQIVDGSIDTPRSPCDTPTPTAAPAAPTQAATIVPATATVAPAAPTQAATIVPATATVAPSAVATATPDISSSNGGRFELVIGKQYALREANNTFRYVKLTHIRFNSAFVGYLFDPCPNPAEVGKITIVDTWLVTTIVAAQAEGLTPTNNPCSDAVALPYIGAPNKIVRSASLKLEIGKQYVVRQADDTFGYYQLAFRGTTADGGVYYRGALCPNPSRRNEININTITDILTVAEALAAQLTMTNQQCNIRDVPYGT